MQKKLLPIRVVSEIFNIAVNDFGAKKSHSSRVLLVAEIVVSGTQCTLIPSKIRRKVI